MTERFLAGFNLFYEESLAKSSREHVSTDLQRVARLGAKLLDSVRRAGALGVFIRFEVDSVEESLQRSVSSAPKRIENPSRRHIDEEGYYAAPKKSLAEAYRSFREDDHDR